MENMSTSGPWNRLFCVLFPNRTIIARDLEILEEVERRLDAWMDDYPRFVFRPQEAVPLEYEDVYNVPGENGPQLWKCLRRYIQQLWVR